MDPTTFDRLTRIISASASRRGALAALLSALGTPLVPATDAARRRKTKGKTGRGKARRKGSGKAKGKAKEKTRTQPRQPDAGAEAARCCATDNCTPGKGKNLGKCCYQGQDLTGKNFSGANLGQANFSGATLTNANLQGANLDKTCLVDADVSGANFGGANIGTAIFCRTETSSGIDNSGCHRGTPCCPTCDAAHPCGQGQVCCNGRCIPGDCCDNGEQSTCGAGAFCCGHRCVDGDCCETADCPTAVCQRRACRDHQCVYTPVVGEPGPGCPDPRICCEDEQGVPICCDSGVTICQTSGVCGCTSHQDCGSGEVCCGEQCHSGVCCQDHDCPPEICQERECLDHECEYTPVSGEPGPGCDTICCQDEQGAPRCCPPGTTTCDAQGLCCAAESRNETCGVGTPSPKCGEVRNICGQPVDCGSCAERQCQTASCSGPDHTCVYTPVLAAPGPLCDERVSPPHICCRDLQGAPRCCEGTQCEANGVCGCPNCPCIGTPNRICSIFGTPCCPGFVCTPASVIFPLLTNCQFPCETHQQCIDEFGTGFICDRRAEDCAFLSACCQRIRSSGAGVSKVGWPRDGDRFDALAKLVWTRTSRGATVGTIAGAALLGRPLAMAAGRKGGNGFAAGAVTFRPPRRRRG